MQIQLSVARDIPAPAAEVFALALDPALFPALFAGCGPIPAIRRITPHAPAAVGSTRELENSDGSRLLERITELDPPRRHAYTLSGLRAPLAWLAREAHADWTFAPDADGTHVEWRYRWELTSVLAWPVVAPLLYGLMRTAMRRCLDAMARTVEPREGPR